MNATIYYEPVNPEKHELSGKFEAVKIQECLRRAFDKCDLIILPYIFSQKDISTLKGMAAVYSWYVHIPKEIDNPYQQIINLIERYGEIKVWIER